jgi:hypothetical protein
VTLNDLKQAFAVQALVSQHPPPARKSRHLAEPI